MFVFLRIGCKADPRQIRALDPCCALENGGACGDSVTRGAVGWGEEEEEEVLKEN